MTKNELAKFDGRDGRPAYVAVNDTIFDVSTSPLWQGGDHQGAHQAGADLTEELKSAPHVRMVIERFPVVGKLEATAATPPAKTTMHIKAIILAIITAAILILVMKLSR